MKYAESGLARHPLLEKAFEYSVSLATTGTRLTDATNKVRDNMQQWYNSTLAHYEETAFTREDFEFNKRQLDTQLDDYFSQAEQLARDILANDFELLHVLPAREVLYHAENATPQVLAATLLFPAMQSDDDIARVRAEFGDEIADMVHAVHHMNDDPDAAFYDAEELAAMAADGPAPDIERDNLKAAPETVQTIYFARICTLLRHEADTARAQMRQNPREKIEMHATHIDRLHGIASVMHGINPEMDRRFRDAFNDLASLAEAPVRLSIDRVGDLNMIKAEEPKMQQVKPKEKPRNDPPSIDVIDR